MVLPVVQIMAQLQEGVLDDNDAMGAEAEEKADEATTNSLVTSAEPFTMPHRICMVSLWCIPEYNPRDCKINLSAQLCLRDF